MLPIRPLTATGNITNPAGAGREIYQPPSPPPSQPIGSEGYDLRAQWN
jgi:hypothetical protein